MSSPYRQAGEAHRPEGLRCLYCGASSTTDAHSCVCGADLPRQAYSGGGSAGVCPRCRLPLSAVSLESGLFAHHCDLCGGLLVGAAEWTEILSRAHALDLTRLDPGASVPGAPSLPPAKLAEMILCPRCKTPMDRARFAVRSGVLVDVCLWDGIWFDAGELLRAADFVSLRETYAFTQDPFASSSNQEANSIPDDLGDLRIEIARQVSLNPELLAGNGNAIYEHLLMMGKLLGLVRR